MFLANVVLYILTFIIGITFGSFFTLAVYRIPLGQDITHTRSYCPNCNHKLGFWDMIPIFSYLFLNGKCRYCHKRIRIRYLLLELSSGIVFTLFAVSIKFNMLNMNISTLVYLAVGFLYIAGLFIIAGIDKEKLEIRNEVILYLIVLEAIYIIYLYIVEKTSIYRYVIYLFLLVIITVSNNLYLAHKAKNNYTLECMMLIMIFLMFTYEACTIFTIECTLLAIAFKMLIQKITSKKTNIKSSLKQKSNIPIGFYLCTSNIIMIIAINIIVFYGRI